MHQRKQSRNHKEIKTKKKEELSKTNGSKKKRSGDGRQESPNLTSAAASRRQRPGNTATITARGRRSPRGRAVSESGERRIGRQKTEPGEIAGSLVVARTQGRHGKRRRRRREGGRGGRGGGGAERRGRRVRCRARPQPPGVHDGYPQRVHQPLLLQPVFVVVVGGEEDDDGRRFAERNDRSTHVFAPLPFLVSKKILEKQ